MESGNFLTEQEEKKLVEHIAAIESKTTGEVRVHLAKKTSRHGVMNDAAKTFKRLGMTATPHHNGVLLYISLKDNELACIGDKGIHEKIGDHGWKAITDRLLENFSKGKFHLGIELALNEIGEVLSKHFPATDGAGGNNSLPNDFSRS